MAEKSKADEVEELEKSGIEGVDLKDVDFADLDVNWVFGNGKQELRVFKYGKDQHISRTTKGETKSWIEKGNRQVLFYFGRKMMDKLKMQRLKHQTLDFDDFVDFLKKGNFKFIGVA